LGKYFRQSEKITAGAECEAKRPLLHRNRRQDSVEPGKLVACEGAVALRQGLERGLKSRSQIYTADDAM
jgi:hypothetical protein